MVVWGGYDVGLNPLDSGGRYNPNSGAWQDTSTTNAPEARTSHTAVWTDDVMVVWGGIGNGPAEQRRSRTTRRATRGRPRRLRTLPFAASGTPRSGPVTR